MGEDPEEEFRSDPLELPVGDSTDSILKDLLLLRSSMNNPGPGYAEMRRRRLAMCKSQEERDLVMHEWTEESELLNRLINIFARASALRQETY